MKFKKFSTGNIIYSIDEKIENIEENTLMILRNFVMCNTVSAIKEY